MPEFHNLQCYAALDSRTFQDTIDRFAAVMGACGIRDRRVDDWLRAIRWGRPVEGFVVSGSQQLWVDFTSAGFPFEGAPHIVCYTAKAFPGQERGWMELGILFRTEDLQTGSSFSSWQYKAGLGPAIWNLMMHFGPAFSEVGVFFTDEIQDGRPLDGIVEGTDARWQFDLAWIPEASAHLFSENVDMFIPHRLPGALGMARKEVWDTAPWSSSAAPA